MVTEIATYTGNVVFEIPNYVTDVKIKFGKATIEIDNFRDKIK